MAPPDLDAGLTPTPSNASIINKLRPGWWRQLQTAPISVAKTVLFGWTVKTLILISNEGAGDMTPTVTQM
jgi:hypothetical protein